MFDKKDPIFKKTNQEPQHTFTLPSDDQGLNGKIVFIGQSICIKGELTGNEDLTIEGVVEGDIKLKDHNLTIGVNGKAKAGLFAKNITIMGKVHGDVHAEEKVKISKSGKLKGNITAPRVIIEDGARFKGSVEMESDKKTMPTETTVRNDKEAGGRTDRAVSMAGEKVGAH